MKTYDALAPEDVKAFEPEAKIGLIATVNPDGLPHVTMISSIRAKTTRQLTWGQFSEGLSKVFVRQNPKTGFLVLTMDKKLWRGKSLWTHTETLGEDFEIYNSMPMFRYNAYFGIHTVHYMDLRETYGRESLPMAGVVLSSLLSMAAGKKPEPPSAERVLKPWGENLFKKLDALKFLAYVEDDGFPKIIPLLQCRTQSSRGLVFSTLAYGDELSKLRAGGKVAVFGLTMDMEDILVRGDFTGFERSRGIRVGRIEIDWVYNSMPPLQGRIYPMPELEPVTDW